MQEELEKKYSTTAAALTQIIGDFSLKCGISRITLTQCKDLNIARCALVLC